MNSGSNLVSETKVLHLVKDVLLAQDFDPQHLENFSVKQNLWKLDTDKNSKTINFPDDWVQTSITIDIPTKSKEDRPQPYTIPGFYYRPLVEVIRTAFTDAQARAFHLLPFKRLWKDPLDGHEERILDELYTSDVWLEAQDDLHKLPRQPGCSLERVIAGLMLFSDATHLANFGMAKAWPLYLYFGNLTKYMRSQPQSGVCHLVGFLFSVSLWMARDCLLLMMPSSLTVWKMFWASYFAYQKLVWRHFRHTAAGSCSMRAGTYCWTRTFFMPIAMVLSSNVLMVCYGESFLKFLHTPLIIPKSVSLPECQTTLIAHHSNRVLIATIKDMGLCPCPQCLIPKKSFSFLGLAEDMNSQMTNSRVYVMAKVMKAREFISSGSTVNGAKVNDSLGEGSRVPVLVCAATFLHFNNWLHSILSQNVFAQKLGPCGLDPFCMLIVDFMHECELGTWKALFSHLIRLLYSIPGGSQIVATLDERYEEFIWTRIVSVPLENH
jgi:hypothetical protein